MTDPKTPESVLQEAKEHAGNAHYVFCQTCIDQQDCVHADAIGRLAQVAELVGAYRALTEFRNEPIHPIDRKLADKERDRLLAELEQRGL